MRTGPDVDLSGMLQESFQAHVLPGTHELSRFGYAHGTVPSMPCPGGHVIKGLGSYARWRLRCCTLTQQIF